MDVQWNDLDKYLAQNGLMVKNTRGDGFCFLSSILTVLKCDYNEEVSTEEMIPRFLEFLIKNHQQFHAFHTWTKPDLFIGEAMDFFRSREYNRDIVDLLVEIAAQALELNLSIYQNLDGQIQVLRYNGGPDCKEIRVKFTHDNNNMALNHYDAIIHSGRANTSPLLYDISPETNFARTPDHVTDDITASTTSMRCNYSPLLYEISPERSNSSTIPDDGTQHSDTTASTSSTPLSEEFIPEIRKGKYFPTDLFDDIEPEMVDNIPGDIDGTKLYVIDATNKDWHKATSDLRHFDMKTSSKAGYSGVRKVGYCKGSWVCKNLNCAFASTSQGNQPNRINWKSIPGQRHLKICQICDHVGAREGCGARKLVDYNTFLSKATVYHLGQHKCWQKPDYAGKRDAIRQKVAGLQMSGSAKQMAIDELVTLIGEGKMDEAIMEAGKWTDMRTAKRLHVAQDKFAGEDVNSFDAVGIVKQKTDTRDPYYIYRINNGNMNNTSDYIFKTSKVMAQLAIEMDINGKKNALQEENAYFDATHRRVHSFKSLGLWLYHPAMRKILRLASMEIRTENSEDIAIFFRLFNEVLAKEKGEPGYKFNPRCFVCDEGGANYKGIALVYGQDFCSDRVRGCQFHFKHDLQRKAQRINPDIRDLFVSKCRELCEVTTITKYNALKTELDELAEIDPKLKTWIKWWDTRKAHIFLPFRGGGLPGVNLSEQGNAGWRSKHTLRLVQAAKDDVATMILQEREILKFTSNQSKSSGRGPSQAAKEAKDRQQQIRIAEDFVNIFDDENAVLVEAEEANNPSAYIPKRNCKHRPAKRVMETKGRNKKRTKSNNTAPVSDLSTQIKTATVITGATPTKSRPDNFTKSLIPPNPPVVIISDGLGIRKCMGCRKPITKDEQKNPKNLVFRRKGVTGYYNTIQNRWVNRDCNIHFHLKLPCLRKHDPTLEFKDIIMTDDIFEKMSKEQLDVLNEACVLKYIISNKQ